MIPLLTAGVPWALMMTWLISSPLNSPNTFFLITGALGYPMAIAQIVAAIAMGVGSGWLTSLLERKGYLKGQIHSAEPKKPDLSGNPFPMVKGDPWPPERSACGNRNKRSLEGVLPNFVQIRDTQIIETAGALCPCCVGYKNYGSHELDHNAFRSKPLVFDSYCRASRNTFICE